MTAITKTWSNIADSAIDPDSPVTTGLVTGLRDNGIFVREWLGESFFAGAVQNHDHDGVNSASVPVGPNALRNGSFEDGETGWTFANFSGGSHAGSTSNHADGAKSMEFVSTVLANGGGEAVSNEYRSCGGNEPIPVSFWVWASVAGVSSRVEVIWYDNAKSQISTSTVRQYTSTPTLARFHGEVVRAPKTARWFRLRVTGGVPAIGTATGTVRFDGIVVSSSPAASTISAEAPLNIIKQSAINLAQGSTTFLKWFGATADSEVNAEVYVARPFTMQELRALASAAVPASQTAVFTVRKNGADTALTCTISGGQTTASDTTNKVNFGRGDRFAIKVVTSASAGTNDYSATAKVMKPGKDVGLPCVFYKGSIISSGNSFGEFGGITEFGTGAERSLPLPRCLVSSAVPAQTTNEGFVLRKNNADPMSAIDATIVTHVQYNDACRHFFDEGDRASLVAAANGNNGSCQVFFESVDETDHDPCPMGFTTVSQTQGTTRYMGALQTNGLITDEGEASMPMPACKVRNLRGVIDTAPSGSETVIVTVRKNGVDTALTLTFNNAGGLVASNLANEVEFAAGDYMSVKGVTSAAVGTRSFSVSMEPFAS